MQLFSTSDPGCVVSLRQAVLEGMPAGGGLYMPTRIPTLPSSFFRELRGMSLTDMAARVTAALLHDDVPAEHLEAIVRDAIDFDAPLVEVEAGVYALELFHGPTLAFKDFGARFMARLVAYFAGEGDRELNILVATSGDTGGAVAHGFSGIEGLRVIVLYPAGRVSEMQERQFTTLGGNVTAVAVEGTFDDCQRMVKRALSDDGVRARIRATSANSINIARLLPQTFYYFYARGRVDGPVTFSVPCGNFGNLCAGLMAKRMGLDVPRFVASTNANDAVPRYLESGEFEPRATIPTISNAMDVGNPGNLERIMSLYDGDVAALRSDVLGISITDDETRATIASVSEGSGYVLDPHGAVAYAGLKRSETSGVFLATAHPAKFRDEVERIIGGGLEMPESLSRPLQRDRHVVAMRNHDADLKEYLLSR